MRLRFIGSGDAFGSGGRFNTCFLVERAGGSFLIDCGASSLVGMRKLGVEPNAIDTIFISHLHGDHFGGLVFLLLDAQHVSRRRTALTIAGPVGIAERLRSAREVLFPGSSEKPLRFELAIHELQIGRTDVVGDVAVTPFQADHSSGAPSQALRLEADGRVITYSGDTAWTEPLVAAAKGADIFVCEASFRGRKVTGHMDVDDLIAALPRIGANQVVLTHMGDEVLAAPAPDGTIKAEDGLVLDL
ncbi:MAG TPA: MBL fold metallo-hydrolase [Caulobacteraceae bacterium]|jgi:ribonuclease BN (tRNA processing enzyme)|nr:MBL fold metallo-hydrolase [Caulobacteraceae bacterium]